MLVQDTSFLKNEIMRLKKEKNVVILAHNYEIPDVQDVADFTGDSLGLSRLAASVNQKTILFCGVHFMAETAAIISPEKKVILPSLEAGCSLSDSITVNELRNWVAKEIGPIAKPEEIRFGDNLPKTRSGKIMRRLLRNIAKGEKISADISTLENPKILDQLSEKL